MKEIFDGKIVNTINFYVVHRDTESNNNTVLKRWL